jgi:uncharacterized protein involved in exopolysaccharide biosynthesis
MEEEKNFIDYLIVLVKWKKFILMIFFSVVFIAGVISFLLPKYYQAETVIMPPERDEGLLGITSLISGLEGLEQLPVAGFGFSQTSEKTKRIMAILESRTIMEKVIEKFDLINYYKQKNITDTIKKLRKNTTLKIKESDAISISVIDKSPKKASDMANYFINELEKMNVELNVEKARNNRIFIEERYNRNKEDLAGAEEKFKEFQKARNVISLPEQTEAAIGAAASLSAEIYRIDIELGIKEKTLGKNHSEILALKSELDQYRKKLRNLFEKSENPIKLEDTGDENKLFIPFSKTPDVGIEYIRVKRELEIQNSIHQMLTTLYEKAKIEEARDTPTIQVLDRAVPPEKKYKPKRAIIILLSGFSSLIISSLFVLGIQRLKSKK